MFYLLPHIAFIWVSMKCILALNERYYQRHSITLPFYAFTTGSIVGAFLPVGLQVLVGGFFFLVALFAQPWQPWMLLAFDPTGFCWLLYVILISFLSSCAIAGSISFIAVLLCRERNVKPIVLGCGEHGFLDATNSRNQRPNAALERTIMAVLFIAGCVALAQVPGMLPDGESFL